MLIWLTQLFLLQMNLLAAEPDNFSARLDSNAQIANQQINKVINGVLEQALVEANSRPNKCDRKILTEILKDELDRNFPQVVSYFWRTIPLAGPRDFSKVPYIGEIPYGRTSFHPSTKIKIKENSIVIGLDKLDHFFAHGFLYWQVMNHNPELPLNRIQEALNLGIAQEEGPWGLKSFGVKSYADLAANYHGLYFWRDLLDGKNPIVVCENNNFSIKRSFDLEDYFSPAMDETINCNSYKNTQMYHAIKTFTDKHKVSCPLSSELCTKLKKDYPKEIAEKILHPQCINHLNKKEPVEKPSTLTIRDILDGSAALVSGGENLVDMFFPPANKYDANGSGKVIAK